jgi:hypothetical protein
MHKYSIILFLLSFQFAIAQQIQWGKYDASNSELPNESVKCIAIDSTGGLWIGTYMGGVAFFRDGNWTIYNTENSDLPHNYVNALAIDKNGVKWIGTDGGGLTKFDGTNWTTYKTSNSGLPSNVVMSIYCDDNNNVWIGTYFGGLAKFDGTNWEVYNEDNSGLLSNKVVAIAEDTNGVKWIGTQGGGLASFDGKNWKVFTESNSKLPNDYIYSIAIGEDNSKWIGTGGGGIGVFNDVFWITLSSDNSGLTDDNIRPIVIDSDNKKWIGTYIGGLNIFNDAEWKAFDFQNSPIPDDEITCMTLNNHTVYIGTERSGIITAEDTTYKTQAAVPAIAVTETEIPAGENDTLAPVIPQEDYSGALNRIVLTFDAADIHFNPERLKQYIRSFKILLNRRERIDDTYDVTILIYSSNVDVKAKSIVLTESQLQSLHSKNVVYLEGEHNFTAGIRKAFDIVKQGYDPNGNNHVIAATYKFIRDSEKAKVVIKDNLDNNYIIFSLIAFNTESWKMGYKVRDMIPKGNGHYYAINPISWKDNWSVTGQIGMSLFRGDLDVSKKITFPGVYGIAFNKQVQSNGIINGGVKAQFNLGGLQGEKNGYTFDNNYFEGLVNFQVILNRWFNSNFKFEKFRPYAFAGVGFISYRVLYKDRNGNVVNGYGYKIVEGNPEANGTAPEKDSPETDIMFPVGGGVNYKLNDKFNIELEVSSRFIQSDKLDGRVSWKNDKYIFFSLGLTYKFRQKDFLHDILNK